MLASIVLRIVSAIAHAVLLLTSRQHRALNDRLEELLQGWAADGPHTTVVGRCRARLGAFTWLGPLRPDAPRDPLTECGMPPAGGGWWTTWSRVACLEDRMAEARAEHTLLETRLLALTYITVCLLVLFSLLIALVPKDVPGPSRQGSLRQLSSAKCSPPRSRSQRHKARRKQLMDAMKAALFRRLRKKAGGKVSCDALDEGALPSPHEGSEGMCAAAHPWWMFLQAATLLLMLYQCCRSGGSSTPHTTHHTTA